MQKLFRCGKWQFNGKKYKRNIKGKKLKEIKERKKKNGNLMVDGWIILYKQIHK